jgi:hypothetical protein
MYQPSAAMVERSNGTKRALPNFASRISKIRCSQRMSETFKPIASPTRIPVAANNPIIVRYVIASRSLRSWLAAAISASISSSEYRYGVNRRLGWRNSSGGGTSLAGSSVCRYRAKLRTAERRFAQ